MVIISLDGSPAKSRSRKKIIAPTFLEDEVLLELATRADVINTKTISSENGFSF
jgi:hypothetical protein